MKTIILRKTIRFSAPQYTDIIKSKSLYLSKLKR